MKEPRPHPQILLVIRRVTQDEPDIFGTKRKKKTFEGGLVQADTHYVSEYLLIGSRDDLDFVRHASEWPNTRVNPSGHHLGGGVFSVG